ncbi:hypothetical protein OEA41_000954 [Lepraria neglecta]|uniref:Major facilitator superfamily (MFS) profile domain-containing protein n=1 Tax=Lepraria neglecta TaxID=209136 RepID=A0AAD9ZJA2_9LECA|nr:hypothetical protein OEA41_000954 [Lepraria neglecta]
MTTEDRVIDDPLRVEEPKHAIVEEPATVRKTSFENGWRYWAVIAALSVVALLPAMEGTVVSTALPTIVQDLHGGELAPYMAKRDKGRLATGFWNRIESNQLTEIILPSTAFQPLYGQTANIFGRRSVILFAISFFMLGTGLSGGANSMTMLIAGRTIQGIGGGGVTMLVDLIICDLVPLRKRGSVMGIIFAAVTVGTALGPFLGGIIVETTTWRWVFYLNLPIGAVAIILLVAFLHVKSEKESTLMEKLKRVDLAGNAIFILATTSILIALTNGGTRYSWSTRRILLPLIAGFIGLGLFYLFEVSKLCIEPTLPPQLFANRISTAAFVLTFIHTLLLYWETFFLPVYFQAVLGSTPARSGIQILPTVIVLMVFGAIGGGAMQKTGRYRPFHHAGFALMTIGFGTFTLLDDRSSLTVWETTYPSKGY